MDQGGQESLRSATVPHGLRLRMPADSTPRIRDHTNAIGDEEASWKS